jgi:SNF2-related domain
MYPLLPLLYHLSPPRPPPPPTSTASASFFYFLPSSLTLSLPVFLLPYSLNRLRLPLTLPPSLPPSPSTGTPIQNNLDELYSVVHFVAPGYLGELADFQRTFSDHISKGQLQGASELHKKKVCVILFLDSCYLLFLLLQCHLIYNSFNQFVFVFVLFLFLFLFFCFFCFMHNLNDFTFF